VSESQLAVDKFACLSVRKDKWSWWNPT